MSSAGKIHRQKASWSPEASQELLRLRFRLLRALFDDAQTVADVHEAWGVLAGRLNDDLRLGLDVDAVKCSDELTRLRQQWQESSTAQLHLMMAECFSQSAPAVAAAPQSPQPARVTFNRTVEEAMLQEARVQPASPKRRKTAEVEADVAPWQAETLHAAPASPDVETPVSPVSPVPESSFPDTIPEETPALTGEAVEEDGELPRQDEIMQAMERRTKQLGRLAQSHKHLSDVTNELMKALVHRHGR